DEVDSKLAEDDEEDDEWEQGWRPISAAHDTGEVEPTCKYFGWLRSTRTNLRMIQPDRKAGEKTSGGQLAPARANRPARCRRA
ncbi:hypothetical protein FRC11_002497, partial [Ceratobasidium sp. 423]